MRILIDGRMYGLENAGIGRYLINLIEELKNLRTKEKFVILLRKSYFNQLKYPANWEKVLADFRHYTLLEQVRLPKIIKNLKPDLVHFPHFNIPVFYRGKFVVTIHDLTMHRQGIDATKLPLLIYYLKRIPYKYAFRVAIKSSAKIITPTQAVKSEIVKYFGVDEDKVIRIHEGWDDKFRVENLRGKKGTILAKYKLKSGKYFIYVGNVYPHKNIKRAIEAIAFFNRKRREKFIFAIAASRSIFTERLEKVIKSLKASKYVRLLGFVPDEELGVLLKNSVAFVYPSLSEGFGLQGLESIAAGTLVLAADIPVFKEVYKDNVLYFNPLDFTSIEKTMRETVDMPKKRRNMMIEKGQKFVKHYSWPKMAKQTLNVYKDVVGK